MDRRIVAAALTAALVSAGILAAFGPWAGTLGSAGDTVTLRSTAFRMEVPGEHLPTAGYQSSPGPFVMSWNGTSQVVPGPTGQRTEGLAVDADMPNGTVTYFLDADRLELTTVSEVHPLTGDKLFAFPDADSWIRGLNGFTPFMLFPLAGQPLPVQEPIRYRFLGYDLRVEVEDAGTVRVRPVDFSLISYRFQLRDRSVMPVHVVLEIHDPAKTFTDTVWETRQADLGAPTGIQADADAPSVWSEPVPAETAPYDRWPAPGQDPAHPFPITEAIRLARESSPLERDDDAETVDAYFEDHPDACLMEAEFVERSAVQDPDRSERFSREDLWRFKFTASDHAYLNFTVHRYASHDATDNQTVASEVSRLEEGTGVQPLCWPETPVSAPAMVTFGWLYEDCVDHLGHDIRMGYKGDLETAILVVGGKLQPGLAHSLCASERGKIGRYLFSGRLARIDASVFEDSSGPI